MSEAEAAYTFTVFTPTFDRAHTLPRVYESLRRQTFRDFEWLVVDDGSSDGTRELVEGWRRSGEILVRYLYQPNSGKHVATNRGVREARGALFLTLDSDDECTPMALERLKFHWDAIPPGRRDEFTGVTCLCLDEHGRPVGEAFEDEVTDSDSIEVDFVRRVRGEKWGFHRTEVLRRHPFPEPPGVKFVLESVVWFAIARSYKTRFVNERLRIYHRDGPLAHRLTVFSRNAAEGRLLFHAAVLNEYPDLARRAPLSFARSAVNYARYSFDCDRGLVRQLRETRRPATKALVALVAPLGYALSVRDRGGAACL